MSGITDAGFEIKRVLDLLADNQAAIQAKFGASANVGNDGLLGKLAAILAQAEADLWELAQQVHASFIPSSASGVHLDNLVELNGLRRKQATYSSVWAVLRLEPATTVAAGKRVAVENTDPPVTFQLLDAVSTPVVTAVYGAWITVGVVSGVGNTYTVTINGVANTYAVVLNDGAPEILAGLAAAIEAGAVAGVVEAVYDSTNVLLRIYPQFTGTDIPPTFSVAVSATGIGTLSIDETGAVGQFCGEERGALQAVAHTLTDILDTVAGWNGNDNLIDATPGNALETDAELRLRREIACHVPTGGPVEGIRSALLELEDVEEAIVLENVTDVTAGGLTPHSVKAIVDIPVGTSYDDIVCAELFRVVAAGIQTIGSVHRLVTDTQGIVHDLYFSRPTSIEVDLRITYHKSSEETFPTGGEALMVAAAVSTAQSIQLLGKDVLPSRYFGPILTACSGIAYMILAVRLHVGPGPWLTTELPINWDERAYLPAANVSFVVIP
jgi:uncharacterized phage protein gp47/JayE